MIYLYIASRKFPLKDFGIREAQWPSDRASDSGARGRGFDPHPGRRVLSLSKTYFTSEKYR